jgi:transcriptional regulator with XRE-family HTH domain
MNVLTHTLPITLQQARKVRRLSQFELSMRLLVSQRHVSFVESGRAKPSRELLMAWLQALDAPLVVRNAAMLQAGYAPAYTTTPLADPALAQANDALVQLLEAHDPQPGFVIDAQWNLIHLNRGGTWLVKLLMPWVTDLPASTPLNINMLDALCHPDGFTKNMINLDEVGPTLLAHLRDDASVMPSITPKVEAFATLMRSRCGSQSLHNGWPRHAAPVLTTRFVTSHGELAFFSMFTTFGTPQDITLASLRVEHMFAANEVTRKVLQQQIKLPY